MKKIILSILLLVACTPAYPLGMNEAQWNGLSPAQQQQAFRQQQEQQLFAERERLETGVRQRLGITQGEWAALSANKKLELRQQQEAIEREARTAQEKPQQVQTGSEGLALATQQIANAINENGRRELYTNAAYGSVVDCEVNGSRAKFNVGAWSTKWRPIAPVRFSVAKGDAIHVTVQRLDKLKENTSFWVGFKEGQELEFCAGADVDKRYKACRSHPVTEAYKQGYTAPFSVPDAIDGGTLSCHFAPGRS